MYVVCTYVYECRREIDLHIKNFTYHTNFRMSGIPHQATNILCILVSRYVHIFTKYPHQLKNFAEIPKYYL